MVINVLHFFPWLLLTILLSFIVVSSFLILNINVFILNWSSSRIAHLAGSWSLGNSNVINVAAWILNWIFCYFFNLVFINDPRWNPWLNGFDAPQPHCYLFFTGAAWAKPLPSHWELPQQTINRTSFDQMLTYLKCLLWHRQSWQQVSVFQRRRRRRRILASFSDMQSRKSLFTFFFFFWQTRMLKSQDAETHEREFLAVPSGMPFTIQQWGERITKGI